MKTICLAVLLATLLACAQVEPNTPGAVSANAPMRPFEGPQAPGHYDTPPRLLSGSAPVYPITRVLSGEDGEATIAFTIAEDGTTGDFEVITSSYRYFGIHAIVAVKEWRFQPALKDGKPLPLRVEQTFHFTLRK